MFLGFVKTYKPRFLKLTSTALLPMFMTAWHPHSHAWQRTPTHGTIFPPRPGKNLVFLQIFYRFLGFQILTYKSDIKLRPTSTVCLLQCTMDFVWYKINVFVCTIKSKDKSTDQWKPKNLTKLKNLVFSSRGWMWGAMCGSAVPCVLVKPYAAG